MPLTISHAKSNTLADFTGTVTAFNSSGGTGTVAATDLVRPSDWNSAHAATISLAATEIASLFAVSGELSMSTNTAGLTYYQPSLVASKIASLITVSGDLSMSTSTNGITIWEDDRLNRFFEPFPLPNTNSTLSAPGIGTWYLDPVLAPEEFNSGLIHVPVVGGASTNCMQDGAVWSATLSGSNTRYHTHIDALAIYSRGSGAESTRLESVWSNQMSWMATWERRHSGSTTGNATISEYLTVSVPQQFDSTGGITYTTNAASGTVSYNASTGASTIGSSLITGPMRYITGSRMEVVPMMQTVGAGNYWFAHMMSSSTSVTGTNYTAGTVITTQSRLGMLENNMGAFKIIGSSTTNATSSPQLFHGYLATTTLSASSVVATTDMRSTTGRAYWNFAQTTY